MEKVWIYLSDKPLIGDVLIGLNDRGNQFVSTWKAHDTPLSATFDILNNRFIIVKVNEELYNASGCSIDKLLRLVKELEVEFNLQLLNRLLVAYQSGSGIEVTHSSNIKELVSEGKMDANTITFNIAASNSDELKNWEIALKDSWLKKYLN